MAGTNEKPVTSGISWGGYTPIGNGLAIYVGTGLFSTTDETVIINHPFGTGAVFHAEATILAGSSIDAQDGPLGFEVGASANMLKRDTTFGTLGAVTSGKAQIRRQASGSSALAFSVLMIGRSK